MSAIQSVFSQTGPKTPADEAIEFFESPAQHKGSEPIQVFELALDADGGPNKERSVTLYFQNYHTVGSSISAVYTFASAQFSLHIACIHRCWNTRLQKWDLQN